jgi:hypothetical protein
MNSNPYELRQGLLAQAQAILSDKFNADYNRAMFLLDAGVFNPKTITWPEPPTSKEIIAEAEKLYKFVQTK